MIRLETLLKEDRPLKSNDEVCILMQNIKLMEAKIKNYNLGLEVDKDIDLKVVLKDWAYNNYSRKFTIKEFMAENGIKDINRAKFILDKSEYFDIFLADNNFYINML